MKLNFQILTSVIDFLQEKKDGRTVSEMRHKHDFKHDPKIVQATIDFMIKNKMIVKTPLQVSGGTKRPTTWVPSQSCCQTDAKREG